MSTQDRTPEFYEYENLIFSSRILWSERNHQLTSAQIKAVLQICGENIQWNSGKETTFEFYFWWMNHMYLLQEKK